MFRTSACVYSQSVVPPFILFVVEMFDLLLSEIPNPFTSRKGLSWQVNLPPWGVVTDKIHSAKRNCGNHLLQILFPECKIFQWFESVGSKMIVAYLV